MSDKSSFPQKVTPICIYVKQLIFCKGGLRNFGVNCWNQCDRKQGPCGFCGTGLCCRKGWSDTSNGCDGSVGINGKGHVCASKGTTITLYKTQLFANIY